MLQSNSLQKLRSWVECKRKTLNKKVFLVGCKMECDEVSSGDLLFREAQGGQVSQTLQCP